MSLCFGCGSNKAPGLDKAIAADYLEFYEKGPMEPKEALAALERAEKADPENAYTQYLKASAYAQEHDLVKALDTVNKANKLERVVIYVATPPPDDPMQTLGRIRQLGFTTAKSEMLGSRQEEYFKAIRKMGARVTKAEPVSSLGVLNGAGVIRKSYQSEIAYWKGKGDRSRAVAAQKALDEFAAWYDELNKKLAETLRDLMRDAGKAAGLTEEEMADYAKGADLKDSKKQAKADEAREKMYQDEIAALRKVVGEMPAVGG